MPQFLVLYFSKYWFKVQIKIKNSLNFLFQPEGKGETLTIGLQNNKNENGKVLWQLDESWSNEGKWSKGRVELTPDDTSDDYEFKVFVLASKGQNNQSFIAFDEVLFVQTDKCDFEPKEAEPLPSTTTTVTTTAPSTTSPPTEPPGPVIVCDFENDLCNWQAQPSGDVTLNWERKTANGIGDGLGPDEDLEGNKDKFFMIASKSKDSGTDNQVAMLRSPLFESKDHPIECFSFWYYFGVSLIS